MPHEIRNLDDGDVVSLRRSDLAALAHAYQSALKKPRMWMSAMIGMGGLALGATLITIGESLNWPAVLFPVFFAGGWAIMLGALINLALHTRRIRARYSFRCPACDEYLLGGPRAPVATTRADVAIATGNCPSCGAHILAPDD